MTKRKKIILSVIIGIFLVLFIFRIFYGYRQYPQGSYRKTETASYSTGLVRQVKSDLQANYATSKIKVDNKYVSTDQKYEMIGNVSTRTDNFDRDEDKVRRSVKEYEALIQAESKSGTKGSRYLTLSIGVEPEKFDEMFKAVSKVGKIISTNVDKTDKTNEYKKLKADRNALEKTRNSLVELKKKSGSIDELVRLEEKIEQYEKQLQSFAVNLGQFDSEHEFCTIKFVLQESGSRELIKISFFHRVKVAALWALKYYIVLLMVVFATLIVVYLGLSIGVKIIKIFEKFKN